MPPPLLFATNQNVLDRFDGRWIGMNINDDGTAATIANLIDLTTPNLAAVRLQNLVGDASEFLMSAAAVGARYAVSDLQQYGGNLVINITCGLAMGPILKRRSRPVTSNKMISDAYNDAMGYIEQLRRGDRIFALVPNVPQAGLLVSVCMTPKPGINPPDLTQVSGRYWGMLAPGCFPGANPPFPGGGGGCGGGC